MGKNVTSPNIARRFGHKLYEEEGRDGRDRRDRYGVRATSQVFHSDYQPPTTTPRPSSVAATCYTGASHHYSPATNKSPSTDRSLTNKVNSWLKDPSRSFLPSPGVKSKLTEIPRIFIYHQSTLKNYIKTWK